MTFKKKKAWKTNTTKKKPHQKPLKDFRLGILSQEQKGDFSQCKLLWAWNSRHNGVMATLCAFQGMCGMTTAAITKRAWVGVWLCVSPPSLPSPSLTFYELTAVVEVVSHWGWKQSCLFSIFSLILAFHPLSVSILAFQFWLPAGFQMVRNIIH